MDRLFVGVFGRYSDCVSVVSMFDLADREECSLSPGDTLSIISGYLPANTDRLEVLSRCLPSVRESGCAVYLTHYRYSEIVYALCDLDGTILAAELLSLLARGRVFEGEMNRSIDRAMRGEEDFVSTFTARTQLLSSLPITDLYDSLDCAPLALGVSELLEEWRGQGVRFDLATGNYHIFAERIVQRLGFTAYMASQLEVCEGRLTGNLLAPVVDARGKQDFLRQMLSNLQIHVSKSIAIGDGANDLPMLSAAGHALLYCALPQSGCPLNIYEIYLQVKMFNSK